MPTSDHRQLTPVLDIALRLKPRHVLDVGIGYGKYGVLLREYLGPDARIVGVEPWLPYEAAGHWDAYDVVLHSPWPIPEDTFSPLFDVGLLVDVIEHFPPVTAEPEPIGPQSPIDQEDALHAMLLACHYTIVATPHNAMQWPQDDLPNAREKHYVAPTLDDVSRFADWAAVPVRLVEAHRLADSFIVVLENTDWEGRP